jgi:hypothetical protein
MSEYQSTEELDVDEPLGFAERCRPLALNHKFSDCVFFVGPDKIRLYGHRVILSASSPVFHLMLYPSFEEDRGATHSTVEVTIPDEDPDLFRIMLKAIYSDKLHADEDDLPGLANLALKYKLSTLGELCLEQLGEIDITADNVFSMMRIAASLGSSLPEAMDYIQLNSSKVLQSPEIADISHDALKSVLADEHLNCEEIDVYSALERWAIAETKRQNRDESEVKDVVHDLLPLVRFPLMDLAGLASAGNLLPHDHLVQLFIYSALHNEEQREAFHLPYTASKRVPKQGDVERWTLGDETWGVLQLSNGNLTASSTSTDYAVCLGTAVWTTGKHAWQVTLSDLSGWVLLGISAKKSFTDRNTYSDVSVHAWSASNQVYPANTSTGLKWTGSQHVHFLYDADARSLSTHTIEDATQSRTMPNIPQAAYCAHFNIHAATTVHVKPIPVSKYAQAVV